MNTTTRALIGLMTVTGGLRAQDASASQARRTTVGVEIDALPYILSGYYGSVWVGRDQWRARAVVSRSTLPSFVVQDGFEDHRIDVVAALVDHFFKPDFRGFWVGGGAEYWQNDVRSKTSGQSASWDNVAATLGGGYVWKFYGNFYLNPWGAGHLIVGGDTKVPVGAETFEPSRFTGEVSLKVGWHF
jgi:hypothetical protein